MKKDAPLPEPPEPKAYIFLNGDFERPSPWPERPEPDDLVVAADGGARHADALGWPLDCLVGDFDSLSPEEVAAFEARGAEIHRHPADKNETDFELARGLARRRGYRDLEILGALGGRWDMTFGNLLLPRSGWGGEAVRFRHGPWTFWPVGGPADLTVGGSPGDLLSLIPLGEDVHGAALSGCRYPLFGETLKAGFTRGLSNELTSLRARLRFESGALLVIHQRR